MKIRDLICKIFCFDNEEQIIEPELTFGQMSNEDFEAWTKELKDLKPVDSDHNVSKQGDTIDIETKIENFSESSGYLYGGVRFEESESSVVWFSSLEEFTSKTGITEFDSELACKDVIKMSYIKVKRK